MDPIDDQIPGQGGAGEAVDTTDEPTDVDTDVDTPQDDPLDDIKDEAARAEAKKARAIARRLNKKDETPENKPEPQVQQVPSDVASKKDLAKLVTNEAKKLVPDEVRDHWDDLADIPLTGFDSLDSESIARNMQERFVIFKQRNPEKVDPTKDMTTSPAIRTKETKPQTTTEEKKLPGWKEPVQPDDWYADPNAS